LQGLIECKTCNEEFHDSSPHLLENELHYCWDCSFIENKISEKQYLKWSGIGLSNAHASIKDGKVVIWIGNKPPWELTSRDHRKDPRYKGWRENVFERDKFTCQQCGQVGGDLHAHHLKSFADYPELRFVESNGQTLCVKCHREVHKRKR
jgi:hypothetical protein